jgi:hypothetical protein
MPIQYVWNCSVTLKANTPAYSEIPAQCIEDPSRGAESAIQRVYPIRIITILVPSEPEVDYVIRVKKEGLDGLIRQLSDSIPASQINKLMSVSGQLPAVFYYEGEPAIIEFDPMEKIYINVVNLAQTSKDVTVSFTVVAEKGV